MTQGSGKLLRWGLSGAVVSALAAAGVWYGYNALNRVPKADLPGNVLPEVVLLPENTLMTVSLNPDPQTEGSQAAVKDLLDVARGGLLATTGINYDTDIAPWLAQDLTVAVLDWNLTANATDPKPGILLVTSTRDAKGSSAFLEKLRQRYSQQQKVSFDRSDAGFGVIVHTQQGGQPGERLVTAELGGHYIALANDPTILQQAIDRFQGKQRIRSLDQASEFRQAIEKNYSDRSLGFVFVNFSSLFSDEVFANVPMDAAELKTLKEQVQGLKSLSINGQWTQAGFLLRSLLRVDPNNPWLQTQVQPAAGRLIQRLPQETLALASFANLAQSWKEGVDRLEKQDPQTARSLDELRSQFRRQTQLDLDKDLLGWMDGEIALAISQDPKGPSILQGLGGLFAIETSQKPTAAAALRKVDAQAKAYGVEVEQDGDAVLWSSPDRLFQLRRAWSGNILVFSTSQALESTFDSARRLPPAFQPLLSGLRQPNYGYLLFDWQGTRQFLDKKLPIWRVGLDPQEKAALTSLGSIGATSYQVDPSTYGFDLLVTASGQ